jgi:uncharacterized lipoprotein YddW (UPF0748 family)
MISNKRLAAILLCFILPFCGCRDGAEIISRSHEISAAAVSSQSSSQNIKADEHPESTPPPPANSRADATSEAVKSTDGNSSGSGGDTKHVANDKNNAKNADSNENAAQKPGGTADPKSSNAPAGDVIDITSTQSDVQSGDKQEALPLPETETKRSEKTESFEPPDETRGVWISYLEFLEMPNDISKSEFTNLIEKMFGKIAGFGLNTVYVQVRPFGDALYKSEIFPWSYVLTGQEGISPGFDPLLIMCSEAKKQNLRIEAWLNPYRIRAAGSTKPISSKNPAVDMLKSGSDAVIEFQSGTYYNPASRTARDLITSGVLEILNNYEVDGIHFDDYFYPTTLAQFDSSYYKKYLNDGGRMNLADWRRENVNALIRQVYSAVKKFSSKIEFGISPQARFDNNYDVQYADIEKWVKNTGYIDYICPQIYFGFKHQTYPYGALMEQWVTLTDSTDVRLIVGLASYKCGTTDQGAKSGSNEWVNSNKMMKEMVQAARKKNSYGGFILYRYNFMFEPEASLSRHIANERNNLAGILGDS